MQYSNFFREAEKIEFSHMNVLSAGLPSNVRAPCELTKGFYQDPYFHTCMLFLHCILHDSELIFIKAGFSQETGLKERTLQRHQESNPSHSVSH